MAETRESLRHLIRAELRGYKFVLVSNREPYMHVHRGGHIDWIRPASGVTTALDPVMQASRGLWVAHGSGEADAKSADARGFVDVPPDRPTYKLRRVWLTQEQEEGYYYGFANSALWPLCHVAYRRPVFRHDQWETYREVNQLFADRVAEEVGAKRAVIFIQDYHFALLPRMLRKRCPHAIIAQFWHIPWPNPEVFRVCPWKHEILDGMLGNDLLGFHIRYHGQNFAATVDRELEARVDRELTAVVYGGHTTKIRAFPISVDFNDINRRAGSPETRRRALHLRRTFKIPENCILGLGVDRQDYTKGIPERLEALERFFELYPHYIGKVVYLQVAVPTRTHVAAYRALSEEVLRKVEAINHRFGRGHWKPVILVQDHLQLPMLLALYRMARFLIVSSLHDGMNLVAKEFVAAQVDAEGVLLLSRFTGAARELPDALLINPYAIDETAAQIRQAIEMDPLAVRRHMGKLRHEVRERTIYRWAAEIIRKLARLT
jgi:alpha,alpha-trehalose-phosphate synthase [UDP-forming]